MKKQIIFSGVLLTALLVTACGGAATETETKPVDTESATVAETETEAVTGAHSEPLNLPEADYGGYEFRILEYEENDFVKYSDFNWTTDEAGELINDAVMKRNMIIEDRYNCSIKVELVSNPVTVAKSFITAGSDDYDMTELYINDGISMATQGMLYNFYDIPNINLEAEWWDQAILRDLSIKDQIYIMTGDISLFDEELNYCVYFNKEMVKEYDLEDPYQIVRDNHWTLDKMHELGKSVSRDLNGDGVMDEEDTFGILTDYGMLWLFYYTSGCTIAEMGSDGEPYFTAGSERASDVVEYLVEFFNDTDTMLWASKCSDTWTTLDKVLMENRGLFRPGSVYDITYYRNMADDFGILPYPKYDESQDYYHVIATQVCPGIAVPTTNSDIDRTGVILEALAYESKATVTNAYYDVNLYTKLARDNDSGEMLDIVFSTKRYDLARVFDWGGMNAALASVAQTKKSMAALWEAKESSAEKAMEKTMTFFRENA